MKIGIDVSGGDYGWPVTVPAAHMAHQSNPGIEVVLYGKETSIIAAPFGSEVLRELTIRPVEHQNEELALAFDDLGEGKLNAIVTGKQSDRLLVIAQNHVLENVILPGLLMPMPTRSRFGRSFILDAGMTFFEMRPEVYVGWALAGSDYLAKYQDVAQPKFGLLNIAEERGTPELNLIHKALAALPGYQGYVEPRGFFLGEVDIWLTFGFVGNAVLKASEEVADLYSEVIVNKQKDIPEAIERLKALQDEIFSYDAHLISPLVGIKGLAFRVHGRATVDQIAKAIIMAANVVMRNPS